MVTKTEALNAFTNLVNNYELGLVSLVVLETVNLTALHGKTVSFVTEGKGDGHGSLDAFVELRSDGRRWVQSRAEFEKSLKRTALREAHEILKWYANDSKQFKSYEALPWYQFARLVRNVLSHEEIGVITLRTVRDIKLPVTWRDMIIDNTMIGRELKFSVHNVMTFLADMELALQNDFK